MRPAAERLASVLLAATIATGLAIVLVLWIDHSLTETTHLASLLALPLRLRWSDMLRRWRLARLRLELRYTLDEIAWTEEDIQQVLPANVQRYRLHAQRLRTRIEALEGQP